MSSTEKQTILGRVIAQVRDDQRDYKLYKGERTFDEYDLVLEVCNDIKRRYRKIESEERAA